MSTQELHLFRGYHVLGEMYGIAPALLDDLSALEATLAQGITASGASLCSMQAKKFEPAGVTLLALLSESHASIHTYPAEGAVFFDAFTCGERCQPQEIVSALRDYLQPSHENVQMIVRGGELEPADAALVEALAHP